MTRAWIFAASRRLPTSLATLAILAILGAALGGARLRSGAETGLGIPWVVMIPVLMAGVVAVSAESPFADFDAMRARSLAPARFAHVGMLLTIAAAETWAMTRLLPAPYSASAALRNLALLGGLGLLSAGVVQPRLAWIAPMGYGLAALLLGGEAGHVRPWAWLLMPDHSRAAALVAAVVFVAGLLVAALLPTDGPARGPGRRRILRR